MPMGKEGACAAPRNTAQRDRNERMPFNFGRTDTLPAPLRVEVNEVMAATQHQLNQAEVEAWVDAASGRCVA